MYYSSYIKLYFDLRSASRFDLNVTLNQTTLRPKNGFLLPGQKKEESLMVMVQEIQESKFKVVIQDVPPFLW